MIRKILLFCFAFFLTVTTLFFLKTTVLAGEVLPAVNSTDLNCQSIECFGESVSAEIHDFQKSVIMGEATGDWRLFCQGITTQECKAAGFSYNGSAVGMINNGIVALYSNPAADPANFVAYVSNKLGFVQPAYAQTAGIGFAGLQPIIRIWSSFRNIAYALLIIIMVVIGFMIMFRRKIDPRTVITVQNALPRIILTLILITFSYAIAGLLIDLMYVVIGLTYVAFGAVDPTGIIREMTTESFPRIHSTMYFLGRDSIDDIYKIFAGLNPFAAVGGGGLIGAILGGVTGSFALMPILGIGAIGAGIAALPMIIIMLAVLFAMLRIYFMLISAYIQVLIGVIFSPLYIMVGAFPGNNSFGSWLRGMVANLSVFAVTAILMVLATLLGRTVHDPSGSGQLWAPPGIAGNVGEGFAGLIGLGMALVIPSIVAAVKEALKAKPIAPVGPSIFLGPLGSTLGAAQQGLSTMMYFKGAFGKK